MDLGLSDIGNLWKLAREVKPPLRVAWWLRNKWSPNYTMYFLDGKGAGLAWDGTLDDVDELRCDGLVELCYEHNGIAVWGKIVDYVTHWDMRNSDYLLEHQEWDGTDGVTSLQLANEGMWRTCLPVTQGGIADWYITFHKKKYAAGHKFYYRQQRGRLWDTKFWPQPLVAPASLNHEGQRQAPDYLPGE